MKEQSLVLSFELILDIPVLVMLKMIMRHAARKRNSKSNLPAFISQGGNMTTDGEDAMTMAEKTKAYDGLKAKEKEKAANVDDADRSNPSLSTMQEGKTTTKGTRLVGLQIKEVSAVDHPAHGHEGWIVAK